ncbi:MAG: MoaD/ThiS family protein [Pirellulaceae bacterium]|nr:MoaD/ThiS family protein [Pirellulaceae bacterium]
MIVQLKLMGMLKDQSPPGDQIEINDQATISDLLASLSIDANTVHVFTVNGKLERDKGRSLANGDELAVFPPVGGG